METLQSSYRPDGKKDLHACLDSRVHNCGRRSGQLQWVRAAETYCEFPIAPMGISHILRVCLQGGGVFVNSGTVTFSSCTITGNTAAGVRAHAQIFPSWGKLLTSLPRLTIAQLRPTLRSTTDCTCSRGP